MKRIIMFVLLFAALKVAGQTTGYLRFDTVRIMKQNGTCELYLINKTKDSLGLLTNVGGGLTQFRRSKMLNDSTIIIGLDTLVIPGSGGGGAGSVTQVNTGYGLIGGPITTTGTALVDTTTLKAVYLPLHLNAAKTINQAGYDITFAGGGKPIFDSAQFTQSYSLPWIGLDSLVVNANSIGVGANATVIPDSSYAGRLSNFTGLPLVNISVSGTTAFQICAKSLDYINPGHTAMGTFCAGFNDPRSTAATVKMYRAIGNAYDAAMINHFLESYTSAQDCTRYGSWSNFNTKLNAGGKTTEGAYSSTTNDSITTDVTGTNVYIGLMAIHAAAMTASIYIDGVLVDVVDPSDGGYTESGSGYQSIGKYYPGLANGSHHVKIVVGTGSNFLMVDYIGVGGATQKPFVFIDIPKMDATGYAGGLATEAITNTINDTITARYNRAFAAGLNVYHAVTNNYYVASTSSGLSSDHIHPNDLGHYQIFSAIRASITSTSASPGVLLYATDKHFYGIDQSGFLTQIAYANEITLQKAINNSGYLPNGNNLISGPGVLNFNGFTNIKLNKFRVSNGVTATMEGTLQTIGASSGMFFGNRNNDTTKGFVLFSENDMFKVFDTYYGSTHIIGDTSLRWLIINNRIDNTLTVPTATLHIGGNYNGVAGHAPLKIGKSLWLGTPEAYAWEVDSLYIGWTNGGGLRDTLATRGWARANLSGGGLSGSGTSGRVAYWDGASSLTSAGNLTFNGTTLQATNATSSSVIIGQSSSSGSGVYGVSNSGTGIVGESTSGEAFNYSIYPSSTNTIVTVGRQTRWTSGTAADGIGGGYDFFTQKVSGTASVSARLTSKWTDATNGIGDFSIWVGNTGSMYRGFTLTGDRQLQLPYYGSVAFTGTPTSTLQSDASGNIIEGPVVTSGTYTPTLTNGTNVDATVVHPFKWTRTGNIVHVSGMIEVDATSNTTPTEVGISLIIASAISNNYEITGNANCPTIGQSGSILGDATNNRASLQFLCASVGNNIMTIEFSYEIL